MDFKNKVAVVTGSARGIGLAISRKFAAAGAAVVMCDVDEAGVGQAVDSFAGKAIGLKTDVTSQDDISNLFETTLREFGRVDIVVNNAGITRDSLMLRMSEKDWDMVLDINLKGAFLVTKAASRIIDRQRGSGQLLGIESRVDRSDQIRR